MRITLKHCNNIKEGTIDIENGKINILYGINGTGKSTIANAIKLKGIGELNTLKPFNSNENSEVICNEDISKILVFNENYIDNYVFKKNELIENSFDIFIKTDRYKQLEQEIGIMLNTIQGKFQENQKLEKLIQDFNELNKAFSFTNEGRLDGRSSAGKAFLNGNLLDNIPETLIQYKPFLNPENGHTVKRIGWQTEGNSFIDITDICPFCANSLNSGEKDTIRQVEQTYNKGDVEKLVKIIKTIEGLKEYFTDEAFQNIEQITKIPEGLNKEENRDKLDYLSSTSSQIKDFLKKLERLKTISSKTFADIIGGDIEAELENWKINLSFLDKFNCSYTQGEIQGLNEELDALISKVGELKGKLNTQKGIITNMVKKNKIRINSFLEKAGYNYEIEILEGQEYKLRLKPKGSSELLENGNQYLSFGEKNAFALILFMYQALSEKPNLIILDDPISSFDNNKKYAIISALFSGSHDDSLVGKNVLVLTHDFEPIIDMRRIKPDTFNFVSAYFLKNNEGILSQVKIENEDIISFFQVWKLIADSEMETFEKIIFIRRFYEGMDNKGLGYQILSNLMHRREKNECINKQVPIEDGYKLLSEDEVGKGIEEIKQDIPDFDYDKLLKRLKDNNQLIHKYNESTSNFMKLCLFRIIYDNIDGQGEAELDIDKVVMKFVKEQYHIENSLLFSLNPLKFDLVPEYIIKKCDEYINRINS